MVTRPATKPEWATLDQVDVTSGQNNVVEPGTPYKNYGFSYQENPVRQFLNWLGRLCYLWIDWFDQQEQDHESRITQNESDISTNASGISTNASGISTNATDISTVDSNLTTETSQRVSADSTLQGNIDAEASTRSSEDASLQSQITTANGNIVSNAMNISSNASAITAIEAEIADFDADTTEESGAALELYGFASNQSVSWWAVKKRYRSTSGGEMTMTEIILFLLGATATSTTTALGIDSASIPAALRPAVAQRVPMSAYDNSSGEPHCATINITPTGNWEIWPYDGSTFTGSGTKGIPTTIIRYVLSQTP